MKTYLSILLMLSSVSIWAAPPDPTAVQIAALEEKCEPSSIDPKKVVFCVGSNHEIRIDILEAEAPIPGPQGLTGLQGLPGPAGIQGIQGIQGETGAQGLEGPIGLQGLTGAIGADLSSEVAGLETRVSNLETKPSPPVCFDNVFIVGAYLMLPDGTATSLLLLQRTAVAYARDVSDIYSQTVVLPSRQADGKIPGYGGTCLKYPL